MQHSPDSLNTDSANPRRKNLPTKVVACHRCHSKKIKCSGGQPCQNCVHAEQGSDCSYPERNRKIKVSQRFIDELFEEIDTLKRQRVSSNENFNTTPPICTSRQGNGRPPQPSMAQDAEEPESQTGAHNSQPNTDINPQTNSQPNTHANPQPDAQPSSVFDSPYETPWFDNRNIFHTPILISEEADAAFATRFRQVISDPRVPEPTHLLRLNYAEDRALLALPEPGLAWPSQPRARFLVEAALKYICRCYYITRPGAAREMMDKVISTPAAASSILSCKYWALFAVGELYATRAPAMHSYPGMAYFSQACKILGYPNERPGTESIETLLLLSIYSLAVNRRYSAYILSGTAMRTAIVMGLHLKIPQVQLPDLGAQEHRKRLFWTTYMFDRMWGAHLGHPAAIQDDDIQVDLPSVLPNSELSETNLDQCDDFDVEYCVASIKLTRHLTSVVRSIYNFHPQHQETQLSTRVHRALQNLQAWMTQLPPHLKIDHTPGVCVILATRPILLHALRVQIANSRGGSQTGSEVPATASALVEACIRCARHSAQLLAQSWIDGLFTNYDCFFTQYLFSSLTILAISSIYFGQEAHTDRNSYQEASRLLAELKDVGNFVAQEYYHHVEAITAALAAYAKTVIPFEPFEGMGPDTSHMPHNSSAHPGVTWNDSSLLQLLSQPPLDMQFIDDVVGETYYQGRYEPDYAPGQ
ncbi:hypothetical protein BO82DRAFT_387384 [Aspergillus uvarum CBS 121591]|uniref:Zn(2)-C6 fungal-type domain-containing protein n=1 Tax=Aspergillus uvarum CBS 121591 TaxID=1448315 RepID=A0A319BXP8_9EURO|nr:hypothetical protein BO82DRAFT_387384 [Aspergillus uvarum CBS 121591]PYH76339.1 hypothetical protein BO82DRAFT_387384 [Aspergillus uvarum CBS 121591]